MERVCVVEDLRPHLLLILSLSKDRFPKSRCECGLHTPKSLATRCAGLEDSAVALRGRGAISSLSALPGGLGTRETHVDWLVRLRCCQREWRGSPRVPAICFAGLAIVEVFHSPGAGRRRRAGHGLFATIPEDRRFSSRRLATLDRIAAASLNRCATALQQRRCGGR